jgi:hypothetical protein
MWGTMLCGKEYCCTKTIRNVTATTKWTVLDMIENSEDK